MQLSIEGWRIDVAARTAQRGGRTEQLSPRALRLLQVLVKANGAVVPRGRLLDRVWPNVTVGDDSLTQVVSEVRRKLGNRDLIATVARGGYRLTASSLVRTAERELPDIEPGSFFSIDAYTLCIEARDCFQRGGEGSQRAFVDLAAEAAAAAPEFAEARALHSLALLKRHIFWSEGETLLDAALAESEAAIRLDPELAHAHLTEAAIRVSMGAIEPGRRSLERALALGSKDAELHLEAAILLLTMGEQRSAGALAIRAAALAPEDFGADLLAARMYQHSDPVRGHLYAERSLRKVRAKLAIDPHSMRALYALGPLLAQLGDHRGARSALESVAHHDSPLEYYRAMGLCQIGDTTAALERLEFLALRGWRHACILDKDGGFRSLQSDARLKRLQADVLAA
ncbi:winged helix-turn-helix domain-containing protein [Roseobacter sp. YSTF-M11]|uniref:Winged helix-turn-helix domain-containing protein n=1 Tax=Roseobacter insulae TaxID=2859783 RepID=A0A9X1FXV5_9RHOB|nr:winged helix-turn-helix domain-containing protein [Roseobacter insulae]MBW4709030.1 winged helix-turn-helix domain-containing protein [Roseobacter insulae]